MIIKVASDRQSGPGIRDGDIRLEGRGPGDDAAAVDAAQQCLANVGAAAAAGSAGS